MSTPMYETPEHFRIPVDKDDNGPSDPEDTVRWVCWCRDTDHCQVLPPVGSKRR
jgi:hypothetical protein